MNQKEQQDWLAERSAIIWEGAGEEAIRTHKMTPKIADQLALEDLKRCMSQQAPKKQRRLV